MTADTKYMGTYVCSTPHFQGDEGRVRVQQNGLTEINQSLDGYPLGLSKDATDKTEYCRLGTF